MESVKNLVSISLQDETNSSVNITYETRKSITLGYPCNDPYKCSPYILDVKPGKYIFECWGSVGRGIQDSIPGSGGYTSGRIVLHSPIRRLYVYVGNQGYFNALIETQYKGNEARPGGATDVRLSASENWWDRSSLISRIMVAGGGGGTEWAASRGGHGGGINGGESHSGENMVATEATITCPGAQQTSGSQCPSIGDYTPISGEFGQSIDPRSVTSFTDPGGMGGGGYYGGTSYPLAFAGSGGSSFISGHEGCDAVENNIETIKHTKQSIHYSGLYFTHTKMIEGSKPMPLPNSNLVGIYSGLGSFRITLLDLVTAAPSLHHFNSLILISIVSTND